MMSGAPAEEHFSSRGDRTEIRLRRRGDFVRASKSGARASCALFTVQMAKREDAPEAAPRFGFTVTRKVAGAVGRNRIRRRLKEALRINGGRFPLGAKPGRDYVFVARSAALTAVFADIIAQMTEGLARLDRGAARSHNHKNRPSAS